jgi:hypothetical protein
VSLKSFVINHVDRVLEYLKQNPLVIYARRTVDAYLAAYALLSALGETAQVAVVDWPPEGGVCVGFKCEGMYITEREVGIDGDAHASEPTSLSHHAASVIHTLVPVDEEVRRALYVGHYAWSVDYCEYGCALPRELARGDERLSVVFPFMDRLPARKALSLSTLPVLPGITGREAEDSKPAAEMTREEAIDLLDWALGVVASEGFHTAILDKAVRPYSPAYRPADVAVRVEADLAGFVDRDVDVYVSGLAEALYSTLRRLRDGVITVQNPFYLHKIPPYLSYCLRLVDWVAVKYETARGFAIALVPPPGRRGSAGAAARALAELGQVLELPTHLVVYVPTNKYTDFLRVYEEIKEQDSDAA